MATSTCGRDCERGTLTLALTLALRPKGTSFVLQY